MPRIDTCTRTGLPARDGVPVEGSVVAAGRSLVLLTQPRQRGVA